MGGPAVYPVLLNKESGTGAATLELTVTVTKRCVDGIDNDGDGAIDFPADSGCYSGGDDYEAADCQNGIDDDGDGLADYPADPGCFNTLYFENPQCDNGIDDDGDGVVDVDGGGIGTPDPQCAQPFDDLEAPDSGCGLGAEVALVLGAIFARRRRAAAGR
jgi:hypothetical protein